MSDSTVLREYLVALGFKVDATQTKKFTNTLGGLDKSAMALGKTILGVAASAQAMVGVFAVQMEKLYYSSKRIGTTVSNLQALKYGASQIGIAGEQMQGSLEGVARAIRSNPGLAGLIKSFGIKVEGRDMSDVALDFVKTLNKMPPYVAERYAALFGIDADTLFQMRQGMAEMEKAAAIRKQMARDLGVDSDKAALAGKEYAQSWREILMTVDLFKEALSMALLPMMREFAGVTKLVLKDWIAIVQNWKGGADFWQKMREGLFGRASSGDRFSFSNMMGGNKGGGVVLSPDAAKRLAGNPPPARQNGAPSPPNAAPPMVAPPSTDRGSSALFSRLEAQYNLPAGLLDRIWKQESGRGRHMLSPAGARGHMGFMGPTAKQYGVKDPDDLGQASEGAAKYMAQLLKENNGDLRRATAAYNWGPGNLQRNGLGAAPKETRDYMDAVAGPEGGFKQTTHITVTGASDPNATARAIADQQRQVNADLIRYMKPRSY